MRGISRAYLFWERSAFTAPWRGKRKGRRKIYRLWSYQCTEHGLNNTVSRLQGKRGKLRPGIHVLCPVNINSEADIVSIHDWKLHSDDYIKQVVNCINSEQYQKYNTIKQLNSNNDLFKHVNKFVIP